MREIGRKKIIERVNAFKNNEHLPDDILTAILQNYSNNNNLHIQMYKKVFKYE
jgi:hypothetical protein